MTLSDVLSFIPVGIPLTLDAACPESVSYAPEYDFYVEPQVFGTKPDTPCKAILFSAPGATGKSALARYISRERNALLWDLSKDKIANHSLVGMLSKAVGMENISQFAKRLQSGKAVLIIDALDEAEMLSGWEAVDTLLDELNDLVKEPISPTIILCSRAQAAHRVAHYCDEINFPIFRVEVGHFDVGHAKDFVLKKIAKDAVVTPAVSNFVDAYFTSVPAMEDREAFIGYAPVLEALARLYDPKANTAHLIQKAATSENSTALLDTVMQDILTREQGKVVQAFRRRCAERFSEFSDWDSVFPPDEQLIRLAYYLVFGELGGACTTPMPSELAAEYESCVETFFPSHPFLAEGATINFAGPAFRDYTLARLMLMDGYDSFASELLSVGNTLSPMFFDFYALYAEHSIPTADHFRHLYLSFKSKETLDTLSQIVVSQEGTRLSCTFMHQRADHTPQVTSLTLRSTSALSVPSLTNVELDVDCDVVLGVKNEDVVLQAAVISCRRLIINAPSLWIGENCQIVCDKPIDANRFPNVRLHLPDTGDPSIKLSIPDLGRWYFLKPFMVVGDTAAPCDLLQFESAVRRILHPFRKHGKDAPGKHREYIENVAVGGSELKRSVYKFFLDYGAIYSDSKDLSQLKLDAEKLETLGLNWGYMTQGFAESMTTAYNVYCKSN